jgi:hypothetical protein
VIVRIGFIYVTIDKVIEFMDVGLTTENQHSTNRQPYSGIVFMVIGGSALIQDIKK